MSTSVFFIVPAPPGISPGQRFRFEHYLSYLPQSGIRYSLFNFFSYKGWKTLYSESGIVQKALVILWGFLRLAVAMARIPAYKYVYIYREAAPLGPPIFEWFIAKVLRKRIIYDFDDAIWIPTSSDFNRSAARFRNFTKIGKICRWSYRVSVGNAFLAAYASKFNNQVVIIPTVVNTATHHNLMQTHKPGEVAVGWTGSFSTLKFLDRIIPVLQEMQNDFPFTFFVIADKDPKLPLKNYRFIPWSRDTEVKDLLNFHIGLMPLLDDDLSKGKCGFKAIQYMSLGIPALVSPVGVNSDIVDQGENGFLCDTNEELKNALRTLLSSPELRARQGVAARKKIEEKYSVQATVNQFIALFN